MVFSLSLAHLTKLLFIFFACLALLLPPLPPLVYGSPILSLSSSSSSLVSEFEPKTISLRQTRAIKSSVAVGKAILITTTTTTSTTKAPTLLSAAATHNKRLQISKQVAAGSYEPQGEITDKSSSSGSSSTTTATTTTTSAPKTISRIPNKTIKQLTSKLGYTALGHTTATEAAPTEQQHHHNHHHLAKSSSGTTERKTSVGAVANQQQQQNKYRLPSWFNYERYKRFYGKHYPRSSEDEIHKRIYLRTALKVFEQRALYRAGRLGSLASMNELSDLTSDELEAFKVRSSGRLRKPGLLATATELKCCTYDQVYSQIIELLNRTSSGGSDGDLPLSRAFIEELEQKSLVGVGGGNEQVANDDGGNGSGSSTDHIDDDDDGNVVVDDGNGAIGKIGLPTSGSGDSSLLSADDQQASEGPPSSIGVPAARRKSMRTFDGGNGSYGNLTKWAEPPQQQQQHHQIGSKSRDHIGQVSEFGHHHDNRALLSSSNSNLNLQTNETAPETSLELVSSSERPNMDSSGAAGSSSSSTSGRLLGQNQLHHRHQQLQLHSQRANGTLLEGKPVIEHSNSSNNNNNNNKNSQQQPHPPNPRQDLQHQSGSGSPSQPRKQSALMGLANEADEKQQQQQQMKSLTSRGQQQKQLLARTGNGSLTIGETASGAGKTSSQFLDGYHHHNHHHLQQQQPQQILWQNGDDGEFAATSQRLATSMRLNSMASMHQATLGDTAAAAAAAAAPKISTRPMYYPPLTQRLPSNGTMDEKSAAASGATKTVASFAGFEGPNMGGQPVRRPPVSSVGRKFWSPASGSDGDSDDDDGPADQEMGSRMAEEDSMSSIGEKNLGEQIGGQANGGPYSTAANARSVTVVGKQQQQQEDEEQQQQQQQHELDGRSSFSSSSDGLELSQAERNIAESVRRQVELQLSGNSTIGRQLTEQFSAYFGEPVVVKATLDEKAVKRALASARGGAKATAAASPSSPSSSSSPP